uniref:Cytochrome b6/f complex subunit VI n=1 Tax=Mallomonas splendens TaxID=52552 RepID=A0A3G2R0B2_9STRA|nr:cytochrome b6/f complex subunit VI [Mallomonas splendens]AYO28551.1 cytochrome b6/f complex subunit VI [Mallomonas splendens]
MTLVLDYLILCSLMFGVVTALYIGLKTIKLI